MRLLLMLVVIASVLGCSKYTTPRKVNRKLTNGTWMFFEFVEGEKSIISSYKNTTISFGNDGNVIVDTEDGQVDGKWTVGTQRNPAVIYIELPATDSMHVVSDDWVVFKLNKEECVLKRNQGKVGEKDEFDYEGMEDRLTLVKK